MYYYYYYHHYYYYYYYSTHNVQLTTRNPSSSSSMHGSAAAGSLLRDGGGSKIETEGSMGNVASTKSIDPSLIASSAQKGAVARMLWTGAFPCCTATTASTQRGVTVAVRTSALEWRSPRKNVRVCS